MLTARFCLLYYFQPELCLNCVGSELVDIARDEFLGLAEIDVEVFLHEIEFSHEQVHHVRQRRPQPFNLILRIEARLLSAL